MVEITYSERYTREHRIYQYIHTPIQTHEAAIAVKIHEL